MYLGFPRDRCYVCLRYVVSPMSPGWTPGKWRARRDSNSRPSGSKGEFALHANTAVQREPMKSTRETESFRLVSDGFVHRSRTITRTISGPGLCHDAGHIQHFASAHAELSFAIKGSLLRFTRPYSAFPSDCLPDVLLQVLAHGDSCGTLSAKCPRVRCSLNSKSSSL